MEKERILHNSERDRIHSEQQLHQKYADIGQQNQILVESVKTLEQHLATKAAECDSLKMKVSQAQKTMEESLLQLSSLGAELKSYKEKSSDL